MWRPDRQKSERHPVRNTLAIAGGVVGGMAVALGIRELARRGHLGERAQAALGGAAIGGGAEAPAFGGIETALPTPGVVEPPASTYPPRAVPGQPA